MATPKQYWHSIRAIVPIFPPHQQVGETKQKISRTADLNLSKGYSIPYDICSALKARRKEGQEGHELVMTLVFQSNYYMHQSSTSQEATEHHLMGDGK